MGHDLFGLHCLARAMRGHGRGPCRPNTPCSARAFCLPLPVPSSASSPIKKKCFVSLASLLIKFRYRNTLLQKGAIPTSPVESNQPVPRPSWHDDGTGISPPHPQRSHALGAGTALYSSAPPGSRPHFLTHMIRGSGPRHHPSSGRTDNLAATGRTDGPRRHDGSSSVR